MVACIGGCQLVTRRSIEDALRNAASKAAEVAMDEQRSRIVSRTRVGLDANYKPMDPLIEPKPSGNRPLVAGMELFGQARVSAAEEGAGATLEISGRDAVITKGQERWGRSLFTITERDKEYVLADFKETFLNELRRK